MELTIHAFSEKKMLEEKGSSKADCINLVVQECIQLSSSPEVSLTTYHNFSVQLLQSADLLMSSSAELEENISSAGRDEKQEHRAFVISSILLSWAFIESTINELCWAAKHSKGSMKDLDRDIIEYIAAIPKGIGTLDKYQIVLAVAKRELFDKGKSPYQNVDDLKSLRNELIHYEPEWITDKPQKIEARLSDKFELNPFLKKTKGSPFMPSKCLSHGCAEWALSSALAFVDDFHKRINMKAKYDHYRSGLKICANKNTRGPG